MRKTYTKHTFRFMRNFPKKYFRFFANCAKPRKTHCVSCAKMAQKFAKKIARKDLAFRGNYTHTVFFLTFFVACNIHTCFFFNSNPLYKLTSSSDRRCSWRKKNEFEILKEKNLIFWIVLFWKEKNSNFVSLSYPRNTRDWLPQAHSVQPLG